MSTYTDIDDLPEGAAAIPIRAMGDRRLSGLAFRVLCVIAAYDDASLLRGRGPGCVVGVRWIARFLQRNYNNVASAVATLVRLGYVQKSAHPSDGRMSTLRVVYTTLRLVYDADKPEGGRAA